MMNIRNLGSKDGFGVKFKDGICARLSLNLWFESNWHFCNINESELFWKRLPRNEVQTIISLSQFGKVTAQKYIAELWTVISNQMIKYHFHIGGSIKLMIINVTNTCIERYPLSYLLWYRHVTLDRFLSTTQCLF